VKLGYIVANVAVAFIGLTPYVVQCNKEQ